MESGDCVLLRLLCCKDTAAATIAGVIENQRGNAVYREELLHG